MTAPYLTDAECAELLAKAKAAADAFAIWKVNPTPDAWKVAVAAEEDFRHWIDPGEALSLLAEREALRSALEDAGAVLRESVSGETVLIERIRALLSGGGAREEAR